MLIGITSSGAFMVHKESRSKINIVERIFDILILIGDIERQKSSCFLIPAYLVGKQAKIFWLAYYVCLLVDWLVGLLV